MSRGLHKTKDIYREYIETILERLEFVEWDRFVPFCDGPEPPRLRLYGWIDRDDAYKDFVLLDLWPSLDEFECITSSERYSERINEVLGNDSDDHVECRRVEDHFSVDNAVELDEEEDGTD